MLAPQRIVFPLAHVYDVTNGTVTHRLISETFTLDANKCTGFATYMNLKFPFLTLLRKFITENSLPLAKQHLIWSVKHEDYRYILKLLDWQCLAHGGQDPPYPTPHPPTDDLNDEPDSGTMCATEKLLARRNQSPRARAPRALKSFWAENYGCVRRTLCKANLWALIRSIAPLQESRLMTCPSLPRTPTD